MWQVRGKSIHSNWHINGDRLTSCRSRLTMHISLLLLFHLLFLQLHFKVDFERSRSMLDFCTNTTKKKNLFLAIHRVLEIQSVAVHMVYGSANPLAKKLILQRFGTQPPAAIMPLCKSRLNLQTFNLVSCSFF